MRDDVLNPTRNSTMTLEGSSTPWAYWAIRHLFRNALRVFYGNIVLEGVENIPQRGVPCILCPNHSNSLMDSLLVCTQIPSERREFIRPVAKSTLWGKRNFGSWLVENTGAVPIKQRRDFDNAPVDNTESMGKIIEALELGDMILMFPEGVSRYHPSMSPLKAGVARIVSDVLSRNRDNPEFDVTVATCSITYTHREHFRSDVLVTFHPPMVFNPKTNPDLLSPITEDSVRAVTERMRQSISSGTWDAPSWKVLRAAKLAANIYAPLGARMSLGNYVRLVKLFVETFKPLHAENEEEMATLELEEDLNEYQDQLSRLGLTDSSRHLRRGPASDTWDEIAEIKVSSGVVASIPVWIFASLVGLLYSSYAPIAVTIVMWMSLRWMEDAVASLRSAAVLRRLLLTSESVLGGLGSTREDIRCRILAIATRKLALPDDPETNLADSGMDGLADISRYFSVLRRRKRDWNEVLRLHNKTEYPAEDS
ncbi:hypothetical protein L227DRAFT_601486 [Lentinus tigrinus ALCF2SS1-6]|uniref:Phospholipid/glycerol acyltransferase domain-containing protein n=1 Tax=Lentinus tigrinus ALCF2SS1-6 TaxID=1328759 RepID=A0A5C2S5Q7_9APHY|nr:hypothetical protein L227DRAFT_601486 [Lentinus tigrinus ALCF2SS1-6]